MVSKALLLLTLAPWLLTYGQQVLKDSSILINNRPPSSLFNVFGGGVNAIHSSEGTAGNFHLASQTYHYFLVTNRKFKNDSIHNELIQKKTPIEKLYNGFDFYLLNRASMDFDTLRNYANDYISSLQASPLTIRVNHELFLSKNETILPENLAPVISIILTGDGRVVPYNYRSSKVKMGSSGHGYVTISAKFKRYEYDPMGHIIDNGIMYFRPSFGLAVGSNELMQSVIRNMKEPLLMSTECMLGFQSQNKIINDFSFLVRYVLSDIIGPKIRAGLVLKNF